MEVDRLELAIQSSASQAVNEIKKMESALKGLGGSVVSTTALSQAGFNNLAKSGFVVTQSFRNMNNQLTAMTSKAKTATQAMRAVTGTQMSMNDMFKGGKIPTQKLVKSNAPSVTPAPVGEQVSLFNLNATQKAYAYATAVKTANNALRSTATVATPAVSGLNRVMNSMRTSISSGLSNMQSRMKQSFSSFGSGIAKSVEQTSAKSMNSVYGLITKVVMGVYVLKRAFTGLGRSIKSSMDFSETVNLFQTTFRKIGMDAGERFGSSFLEQAQAFNDKLSEALTLDPNMLMNYQARFAQMSNSMGVTEQSAVNISSAFTMLGTDISSLFNIDIATAMKKLQSGLAGQIRPLRELGVDISKTSIMQTAYNYGIETSIEKMSASAKVQLRFISIMKQMRVVMGDMARTIDSPANQLRILSQQWDLLSRSIGNVFLPIISAVLPYLNGLMIVLRELIQSIAELFGWEMPDWTGVDIYRGGLDELGDGLGDTGDKADNTAKKLKAVKDATLGFDELNVISPSTSDADKNDPSKDDTGSGYGILDKVISKEYANYLKQFNEQVDKMSNTAKNFAEEFKPKLVSMLKLVLRIGAVLLGWGISKKLAGLIAKFQGGGLFGKIMSSLGIGSKAMVGLVAGVIVMVTRFLELIVKSKLFRKGLVAIVKGAVALGEVIGNISAKFDEFLNMASLGSKGLDLDFSDLALTLGGILMLVTGIGAPLGVALLAFEGITFAIRALGLATSDCVEEIDIFGDISKETKTKVKPFLEAIQGIQATIDELDWSGLAVSNEDIASVKSQVDKVVKIITDELSSDRNQALANLRPLKKAMGEEAYNDMVGDTLNYYNKMNGIIASKEKRINWLMADAQKAGKTKAKKDYNEIQKIISDIMDLGVSHLSANAIEYKKIMNGIAENDDAYTAKEISNILKKTKKLADSNKDEANTLKAKRDLELEHQLKIGVITKKEFDDRKALNEKVRVESIKATNKMYDDTFSAIKSKHSEELKLINKNTGEIKQVWENWAEDLAKIFDNTQIKVGVKTIFEGANKTGADKFVTNYFKQLKDAEMKIIFKGAVASGSKIEKKAKGGIVDYGQLFVAREAGAELVGNFGNHTGVMNNDQIVDSVASGVYSAVKSAMGGNGKQNIDLKVYLDGKQITAGVEKVQKQRGYNLLKGGAVFGV